MPVYCYQCPACKSVKEICRPVSERNDALLCDKDGFVMNRDFTVEHGGYVNTPGAWPMLSDALGVHPDQIRDASAEAAAMGVPTQFASDGRAIITSREHRKQLCQVYGFFDKSAGYGDASPRNR
jgi:hypothetical protein